MHPCRAAAIALCAAGALAAQNAAAPKFEAASVKRAERCAFENSIGSATVVLKGDPLTPILMEAFHVTKEQIAGPSWLEEDCFEIFGKVPEGAAKDQIPGMLQALLAERFKLAAHRESRTRTVYALVVDKGGPKFQESAAAAALPTPARAGQTLYRSGPNVSGYKGSMTMATFARLLSGKGYGPVQDFTGLTGKYDIDISWAPDRTFEPMGAFAAEQQAAHPNAQLPEPPTAGLFDAVRESLGLRLEPRKEPVEVLVIDHIERVPTEN